MEELKTRPNDEWEQQQEVQEEIDKSYQQEDQGYELPIESYWDRQYWEEMAEPDEVEQDFQIVNSNNRPPDTLQLQDIRRMTQLQWEQEYWNSIQQDARRLQINLPNNFISYADMIREAHMQTWPNVTGPLLSLYA